MLITFNLVNVFVYLGITFCWGLALLLGGLFGFYAGGQSNKPPGCLDFVGLLIAQGILIFLSFALRSFLQ